MITLKKPYLLAGAIVLFLTVFVFVFVFVSFNFTKVKAAISNFTPSTCYTAAATSTVTYMTAGLATSTVSCGLGADGVTSARVNVEINASSSPLTVYNFNVEESMDNQDWFPVTNTQQASTTGLFNVTVRYQYTVIFASSTIGGTAVGSSANQFGIAGTNNRNHYSFDVPVTMRYVRVYASLPPTSAAGAIWMQILPRQNIN